MRDRCPRGTHAEPSPTGTPGDLDDRLARLRQPVHGKIVCHFQSAATFKARYATLGFSDQANLDDGTMWAAGFALTEVTAEVEARISALVQQAVS